MGKSSSIDRKVKKKRKTLYFLIMIFLCAIAFILIFRTDLFTVQEVRVSGNEYLKDEKVIYESGITLGNNIFKERFSNIKENLQSQPYIKHVKMKRVIPNKISIEITERRPVAYIPYMGNFIIIDEEGVVLESTLDHGELVLIKGIDLTSFNEGEALNMVDEHQLNKAMEILREVNHNELSITEIDVTAIEDIRIRLTKFLSCKLGKGQNLSYKFMLLQSILQDLNNKEITRGIIDISHDGYPSYRPIE